MKNVSANASETLTVLHRPVTIAAGCVIIFPGEVRVGLGSATLQVFREFCA